MDTYMVEKDSDGGFRVRVTSPGGEIRYVPGFVTEREAEDWLNDQIQIAIRSSNASDVA